jgi:multiple sugar transport system permease protein
MTKAIARAGVQNALIYVVLFAAVALTVFPLLWLLVTSLKLPLDYYSRPPIWIPHKVTLSHYIVLLTTYGAVPFIRNSLIISIGNTILVLLVGIPTAYAISRYNVGGRNFAFWILSTRMLPPVATLIPLFLLFSALRLIDTYIGMILTVAIFNLSFAVWMLSGFFRDTPQEIFEAAMLDGCNELEVIFKVIIPIVAPGVAVVALFCFVYAWNELMFAITFTRSSTKTLMVLITSTMQSPTQMMFGEAAGAAVIGVIPPFLMTLFFQRYLVRGLSYGAVKG